MSDALLQVAANRLRTAIRSEDTVARLGGDEFVIILTNLEKVEHIETKIKKILQLFHQPFIIEDRKITLTASVGVSYYPQMVIRLIYY